MKKNWLAPSIALGTVWGCSFIFIKLGLEFLRPVGVAFGRTFLGALALVTISRIKKTSLPKDRRVWIHLWVVSMLFNVVPGVLFAVAETKVTSILAGIINAVTPLMTLLVVMTLFREEKPKRYQVVGLLIGFAGVLTVLGAWKGLGANPIFAILALLTAITLLPFYLFDGIAQYQFRIGPIASSVTYVMPVLAVIVGVLFLSEPVTWNEPVGGGIVLLGAAISQGWIKFNRV